MKVSNHQPGSEGGWEMMYRGEVEVEVQVEAEVEQGTEVRTG